MQRSDLVALGVITDIARPSQFGAIDPYVIWLRNFIAAQYVKRAPIPTYKCRINYSITSSAMESTPGGTSMPSARAV